MIGTVYLINLAASTDRWRTMQPLLDSIGIAERIRFDAVDGAALGIQELAALRIAGRLTDTSNGFDARCRAGEIGCVLSHAGVLADIVARECPAALILEDDIALAGRAASWRSRFDAAFADLPPTWEQWYLYRCFDIKHQVERLSPRTVVPWSPLGGAAYAVSLAGARKLLAGLTPATAAVDRTYAQLVQQRRIEAYAASPLLVRPGRHPSVINRGNQTRRWVTRGINRPPEYWPRDQLAHLGEALPAETLLQRLSRIATRR